MIIAIGSADIHQLIQRQQEEKKGEKKKRIKMFSLW